MTDKAVRARELLENGAYREAAEIFLAVGEQASAARAFVCCKEFHRAAECYERIGKLADAGRLYLQTHDWQRSIEIYTRLGDQLRVEIAQQKLQEEETRRSGQQAVPKASEAETAPSGPAWPEGEIWQSISAGNYQEAADIYLGSGGSSGWTLLDQSKEPTVLKALGAALCHARDFTVAAEAFQRAGDGLRTAKCLSLAGLHEEAAHMYMQQGEEVTAAQHLEKARAWDQAATIYRDQGMYIEAARCHEKKDEPTKAAAMFLKADKADMALPILQGVPTNHPQFAQCRLLAGKILFQKNQGELALSMLSPILQMEMKGDREMEIFYQLGCLLEMGGALEKAGDIFTGLQKFRFGYKDVTERLEGLIKKLASPDSAPPVPGPEKRAPAAPPSSAASITPPDLKPLRNCSLLDRLDLDDLRSLYEAGEEQLLAAGQLLLKGGQQSEGLYVVLSGGLTITKNPDNPKTAVGFLGPADYVGLGILVKGPPQRNALVAQRNTRLLFLPIQRLESLFSTEPELGFRFYRTVAEHLVQTLMAGRKSRK